MPVNGQGHSLALPEGRVADCLGCADHLARALGHGVCHRCLGIQRSWWGGLQLIYRPGFHRDCNRYRGAVVPTCTEVVTDAVGKAQAEAALAALAAVQERLAFTQGALRDRTGGG